MDRKLPGRAAIAVGLWLATAASPAGQPGTTGIFNPPLSPRIASYSIDTRLDPATRTLTGSETITWTNTTARAVDDLRLHLYWNAWRDDRSTFRREQHLAARTRRTPRSEDWAHIDVTALRLAGGAPVDLTSALRFVAPDDGNVEDGTVASVALPSRAQPGTTLTIQLTWTARVPRTFARTGAVGRSFFLGQWFPKLGVLEDGGWNCHQFHLNTEFFADFGSYDVRMTVPEGWAVGATGVSREVRHNPDGTATHRYYQDDVHDFAWTASPDYVERRARFEHPTLPAVDLRLLLQPEHAGYEQRYFAATRDALRYYGEWFGAYPYGHLTIVDPAYQSNADGMEYPTLFTGGANWLDPSRAGDIEATAIHEAGHQFWYGIVANNEFEDAWLDEGLNTYADTRAQAEGGRAPFYSRRYFGGFIPYVFTDIPLEREYMWNMRGVYLTGPKSGNQSTPTYRYDPTLRSPLSYHKTALWLMTMERWLGWPVQQRILSTFFERWKFKHPKPDDFFRTAVDVAGAKLGPFFDQTYRSSDVFDYGVQTLRSEREGTQYRTSVMVRRYGEAIFPVDLLVTFDGGATVTERWDGRDRWRLYSYVRSEAATAAEVDPGHVLMLDVNLTNNSRTLAPRATSAATKWSLTWMVWLQDCLLSWSFLV